MAADRTKANYPAQNAGNPTRDRTAAQWRNSILVGPQTAGIPTIHNEDELVFDSDSVTGDRAFDVPSASTDYTGGAVEYLKSQRRR
jgi:hypothetical protein